MRRVVTALLGLVLVAEVSTGCDSFTPAISPPSFHEPRG